MSAHRGDDLCVATQCSAGGAACVPQRPSLSTSRRRSAATCGTPPACLRLLDAVSTGKAPEQHPDASHEPCHRERVKAGAAGPRVGASSPPRAQDWTPKAASRAAQFSCGCGSQARLMGHRSSSPSPSSSSSWPAAPHCPRYCHLPASSSPSSPSSPSSSPSSPSSPHR